MSSNQVSTTTFTPIQQAERIQIVDVLRGFALFGILFVNIGYIAYRTGPAKGTAISPSRSGILALSRYLAPSLLALIGGT